MSLEYTCGACNTDTIDIYDGEEMDEETICMDCYRKNGGYPKCGPWCHCGGEHGPWPAIYDSSKRQMRYELKDILILLAKNTEE